MFGDWGWDQSRSAVQSSQLQAWLDSLGAARLAVVECGAGTAIPTVRHFCEEVIARPERILIRINLREASVPAGHIALAQGALEALQAIAALVSRTG